MKTLDKKYAIISALNLDVSKDLEQFTPKQIEACDSVTRAIMDYNFKESPKPEIPETANIKLAQAQDMQLASEVL